MPDEHSGMSANLSVDEHCIAKSISCVDFDVGFRVTHLWTACCGSQRGNARRDERPRGKSRRETSVPAASCLHRRLCR